jgi:hypothetical protein
VVQDVEVEDMFLLLDPTLSGGNLISFSPSLSTGFFVNIGYRWMTLVL